MMADAGVARDPGRLPWLEPYRAPPRKTSNRSAGMAAAIGAIGLVAVVTLLMRDVSLFPTEEPAAPQAIVVLPAPVEMQPQVVLPALSAPQPVIVPAAQAPAPVRRTRAKVQRRIKAVPTSAAYREVVAEQAGEAAEIEPVTSDAASAIAALPPLADPLRPTVDPTAQVVRGKTVQLGVYKSQGQAEAAWRSAVRDYTYLVTMPKSIEPISIRSKRFYRLQLGTPSKKHAKQLCSNLKSIGRSCTVA
ncbi:SPOR domain-containing protein [Sphingomonas sp. RB56-2]|uniref:SPOR domain-containing protein n=1 Tax=Sphingomonas brevis TaxID=2908206 RepID=A0ABT0S5D0_9SPHN|nr:SPOR domain-containing protein [Sphingomonas brevis]MCL6739583.1 SPOR domain-containing protein [Sphingomonas brevis]